MREIAVITKDIRLIRKLRLALVGVAGVEQLLTDTVAKEAYDAVLIDVRGERSLIRHSDDEELSLLIDYQPTVDVGEVGDGYIPIVWRENLREGALPYPFRYSDLDSLLIGDRRVARLALLGDRMVRIDGEKIRLSLIEYKLLSLLIEGDGFVPRHRLVESVWGEGQDEGVLNVYVHYLREKLERDGERLIISSRKEGYKINENYLGGRNA